MKITQKNKDMIKRCMSIVLAIVMIVTGVGFVDFTKEVYADTETITLYFIDNTAEQWVKNDDAIIQLVDNTNGHDYYDMVKIDDTTWSVNVPKSAYNITFNRLNPSNRTQWNSWSAGGRDSNNAYYADGAEYGHWNIVESHEEENYFHAGDIVYLDLTSFTAWENDDALMYINFTDVTKSQNGGNNINIADANSLMYAPRIVDYEIEEHVYAYIVTKQDEGKDVLRFWRGNTSTLWNCSVSLTYESYLEGIDCVKVTGWSESGNVYKSDYMLDVEIDTDSDGIPDYDEVIIGTDRYNADTDGDGINDYYELEYGYSPLVEDTDANGIQDGFEDYDNDKLTNLDEFIYRTSMAKYDTDEDGISDYDEIFLYGTNPCSRDTDNDGITDDIEIELGTNPILADSDGNGIPDSEEKYTKIYSAIDEIQYYDEKVYPVVQITGNSEVVSSFEMDTRNWDSLINCNVPGYIGNAYTFACEGEFDSSKVKFIIDEEIMSSDDFIPAIYYYDEDKQLLEKLDNQIIEENTISVELEHFSTYIVLNQREFDEVWDNDIVYYSEDDVVKPIKIAFALDCSGSMYSNDSGYLRRTVSNLIIDKMTDEDLGSVILFSNRASVIQGMTSDKNLLKNAINATYSSGMTALYYSLNASINQFSSESIDDYKNIIILLSDGYDTEGGYTVNNIAAMAKAKNIKIFTIGLGNGIDVYTLSAIATQTGGKYYHATAASELEWIYTQIGGETVDAKKDSNNDGISDYYTKLLCEGKIRTGTGIPIFDNFLSKNTDNTIHMGCTYEQIQQSSDLDGDGLKNGEEIQIVESGYGVYAKKISDPCEKDSDYDTYSDYKEVKIYKTCPLRKNVNIDSDDILFLADDSEFYSSIYSEEYSELLSSKKISAWIGNKVYGSSYSDTNIMEEVLMEYLLYINDIKKEELITINIIDDINQYMSQMGPVIKEIADKSRDITGIASYNVEMLQNKYYNLQDKYFQIIENGSSSELKAFMSKDAMEVLDQYYVVENELSSANVKCQKIGIKWKMPNFTKTDSFGKAVEVVGFVIDVADIINDYSKGQSEFMTIQNNIDELYADIYILENIKNNSKDKHLREAADNLIDKFVAVFHEDYDIIVGALDNAVDNFGESLFRIVKSTVLNSFDLQLINISLGISNAITGYSEVSKEAVKVYVMGTIPRMMYEQLMNCDFEYSLPYINNQIKSYNVIYYDKLSINAAYTIYNNLISSRIFAEMRMIKLQKSGAKWLNRLYDFLGSNREEIISDCEYMIQQVEKLKIIK